MVRFMPHKNVVKDTNSAWNSPEVRAKRDKMDKGLHIGSWGQLQGLPVCLVYDESTPWKYLKIRMESRKRFTNRLSPSSFALDWSISWICYHFIRWIPTRWWQTNHIHQGRSGIRCCNQPPSSRERNRSRCWFRLGKSLACGCLGTTGRPW